MTQHPFAALFPSPEEVERQRVYHQMLQQDWRNRVRRILDELSPEALVVLRDLFDQSAADPAKASYYEGILAGIFSVKFGDLCEGCGENHSISIHSIDQVAPLEFAKQDALLTEEGLVNESMVPESGPIANLEANLNEYHVYLADKSDPLGEVRCRKCGASWVSLEDRMLREPGVLGCGNCMHIMKWG